MVWKISGPKWVQVVPADLSNLKIKDHTPLWQFRRRMAQSYILHVGNNGPTQLHVWPDIANRLGKLYEPGVRLVIWAVRTPQSCSLENQQFKHEKQRTSKRQENIGG